MKVKLGFRLVLTGPFGIERVRAPTFDSANFDHNRNLYLLDFSLRLMIEIYSRDVLMSQLSTFISIVEKFQSYET